MAKRIVEHEYLLRYKRRRYTSSNTFRASVLTFS